MEDIYIVLVCDEDGYQSVEYVYTTYEKARERAQTLMDCKFYYGLVWKELEPSWEDSYQVGLWSCKTADVIIQKWPVLS